MTVLSSRLFSKSAKIYSLQEYLQREERSLEKHEFYNGRIFRMPGSKVKHNIISTNVLVAFKNALKNLEKKYYVINSDQKIYIETANIAVYPDALIVAEKIEYFENRKDLITNPLLIVEVASKSTRDYDSGEKFMHYRNLPSFKEYILIEQDSTKVESWFKPQDNTWIVKTITEPNSSIFLESIGISILLSDIYEDCEDL